MFNLSLARIMYGTNQDLHAPNAYALSSPATRSSGVNPAQASGGASLGSLLRKAWAILHR